MGWSWRRSLSLGPIRLNFSKSGVGMSMGVRGARVSTGPRGNFMTLGLGGFRYSKRIGIPVSLSPTHTSKRPALLNSASSHMYPAQSSNSATQLVQASSISAGQPQAAAAQLGLRAVAASPNPTLQIPGETQMTDQIPYCGFDATEFAENPEPRVACVLLLDVSGSMNGPPIDELNSALVTFKETMSEDSLARKRAEIAIIAFGGVVDLVQDFVTAETFTPPVLQAHGDTPMGQAIIRAIDLISERKQIYKSHGISYYRPWIFLLTDGGPTDSWHDAANRVKQGENDKSFVFFAVGVEKANMEKLRAISVRDPLKLKGLDFRGLFLWLSQSMQSVSRSSPGDKVSLPQPSGWNEI